MMAASRVSRSVTRKPFMKRLVIPMRARVAVKIFPAAMDHENFVAGARDFGDLARDCLHVFFFFEQRSSNFHH